MIPADWDAALDVRLWDRFFDNYVQEPVTTIVSAHLTGLSCDQTKERTKLKTAYKMIEKRMATRSWMCGEAFSLADCAAAPALFYAATLLPFPEEYQHLQGYFERLVPALGQAGAGRGQAVLLAVSVRQRYPGSLPLLCCLPARLQRRGAPGTPGSAGRWRQSGWPHRSGACWRPGVRHRPVRWRCARSAARALRDR
jgi:hypothetical protein